MTIVDVDCPLCGSSEKLEVKDLLRDVEIRVEGHFAISRCSGCSFIYLSSRPSDDSLPQCYTPDYYTQDPKRQNPLIKKLYSIRYMLRYWRLKKAVEDEPSTLVELGCGDGEFLHYLRTKYPSDTKLFGIDIFSTSSQNPSNGIIFHGGSLEKNPMKEKWDLVLLYEVLEHLQSPKETLFELARRTQKNALLVGTVPCWDSLWRRIFSRHWSGLQIPRHLSFFDRVSLGRLFESTGFRLISISPVYDPGDLSLSLCNWLTDILGLQTLPRKSWFFLPLTLLCAPLVFLQVQVFRTSGVVGFVARREG